MTDTPKHHDGILILDYGSQFTQLIARRVREAHVYCEIHPRHPLARVDPGMAPEGDHPLRRPELRVRRRRPDGPGRAARPRRAGPRALLRDADHRPDGGRQGGRRRPARVRPGRS